MNYFLLPLLGKSFMVKICGTLSLFLLKTYWKNLIEEMGCQIFNKGFFSPPICLIRCFSIEGVLTKGCADGRENIQLFDQKSFPLSKRERFHRSH